MKIVINIPTKKLEKKYKNAKVSFAKLLSRTAHRLTTQAEKLENKAQLIIKGVK